MKYFETKHEKDSAKITTLIGIIIVLLLFVVGHTYLDPPEEYGVAVNFGTTDFGSGQIQPREPIKSTPQEVKEIPKETTKEVTPKETTTENTKSEEVVMQDNEESIAIKKQKAKEAAERRAKAEAERIERAKKEAEERKKREEAKKRKALDDLIGGVSKSEGNTTGSEGNDNSPGDKGQIDGNPYANSYYGEPGSGDGGLGYGLKGRGRATYKTIKQECNEEGLVIVKIVVNREGRVIEATPGVRGTTNNANCLLVPAKKIALSHKWRPDPKAPAKQIGFVKVNFNLGG